MTGNRITGLLMIFLTVGWASDQIRDLPAAPTWWMLVETLCILASAGAIVSSLIRDRLSKGGIE